jgi:hypothetical protein
LRSSFPLDRHLQHASDEPVVTVDRRRCDAGGDLVVQPVLDLIRRQASQPVRAESREHVLVEVSLVRGLRRWRQSAAEREELLAPLAERDVGAAWVDPCAPLDLDLLLTHEAIGVGLARERLTALAAERVAIPRAVLAVALLDESHWYLRGVVPIALGASGEREGAKPGVFRGSSRCLPVTGGHSKNSP